MIFLLMLSFYYLTCNNHEKHKKHKKGKFKFKKMELNI